MTLRILAHDWTKFRKVVKSVSQYCTIKTIASIGNRSTLLEQCCVVVVIVVIFSINAEHTVKLLILMHDCKKHHWNIID